MLAARRRHRQRHFFLHRWGRKTFRLIVCQNCRVGRRGEVRLRRRRAFLNGSPLRRTGWALLRPGALLLATTL